MGETASEVRPILVGTDFRPAARAATNWAARRAMLLGAPLKLVMSTPALPVPARTSVYHAMLTSDYLSDVEKRAREHLEDEADRLRGHFEGLQVDVEVTEGDAAGQIVKRSADALLTVIGTHGKADLSRRVLGGVAEGVIEYAQSTVVAVPPHPYEEDGPVVVGMDYAGNTPALQVGLREAQVMGRPLVALHAWHQIVFGSPFDVPALVEDIDRTGDTVQRALAAALAENHDRYGDVETSVEVVSGFPREVLIDHSRTASALAIGARGGGGFLGLLLGSTTRHVVRHAECPVIVVRRRST